MLDGNINESPEVPGLDEEIKVETNKRSSF